ncbi:serine acetyltransferase [Tsukamurella soli]
MITSRSELDAYLQADLRSYGFDRWSPRFRLTQRPLQFQRLLRKSEFWANTAAGPLRRAIAAWYIARTKFFGERLGYSIPRNVFGPGLSIAHTGTIVVNQNAIVGRNCRLHQGVTIGEANGKAPVIGDDVHISPNAMVIGADVGDRVGIRAGAVVTKDVPDDVDVGGVPAHILNRRAATLPPSAAE